jgi:uncharacterized protein
VSAQLVHLELHAPDRSAARSLYRELLGWRAAPVAGGYLALHLGAVDGGIVECGTRRPLWLPYFAVDDVFASTARACELGAQVLLGPREGPSGWRSVVATAAGGELAMWQAKRCGALDLDARAGL